MSNIYDVNGNEIVVSGGGASSNTPIELIAHRGVFDGTTIKENTIEAFERAKELGYTGFECDACVTSDGVLVLDHEGKETKDGTEYTFSQYTYADLLALFPYLTTLEDALVFAFKNSMTPVIDRANNYAEAISDMVIKCGMQGKVIYRAGVVTSAINLLKSSDPYGRFMIDMLDASANNGTFTTWKQTLEANRIVAVLTKDQGLEASTLATLNNAKASGAQIYLAGFNRNQYADYFALYPNYFEPASIFHTEFMTRYNEWLAS